MANCNNRLHMLKWFCFPGKTPVFLMRCLAFKEGWIQIAANLTMIFISLPKQHLHDSSIVPKNF